MINLEKFFRPQLDKIPIEEIEKEWKRHDRIVDHRGAVDIVEALSENEIVTDVEKDVYLRRPTLEELNASDKCLPCYHQGALKDLFAVYVRRND
ncbi:MAG: hypothetical protein KKF46_05075 [Nanoarchaeota archaeon]|nr:hypothetical protein [Nanoarchaeota archaeon]MBU1321706.1 hypothetical protein [Nanoarchaeota archaeon]MBU1597286.1 hypothetical protein [Nanoarchaeota archaeon]MBU2442250.1 hypothetical protein [Nanoarchaeota archaeon]